MRANWTLTTVYGPCVPDRKLLFFYWLSNISIPDDSNWLIFRDFNLIRKPTDRNKPGGNVNEIMAFNEAISRVGLEELSLKRKKYTWTNKQENLQIMIPVRLQFRLIFQRLRFLVLRIIDRNEMTSKK